jgi:4-coumarate--CoA ligase
VTCDLTPYRTAAYSNLQHGAVWCASGRFSIRRRQEKGKNGLIVRILQKVSILTMKIIASCRLRFTCLRGPLQTQPHQLVRSLSIETQRLADRCSLNIVSSPFPPIRDGPYPPLYEFMTTSWKPHGGYLDKQVAIVDGTTGAQRNFADHHKTIGGLAAALRDDMDIQETDCVALYCPNHVDYLPTALAVSLTGAKLTPINPLYTQHELGTILERSRSSVLITHHRLLDVALQSASQSKFVKHVIVLTDHGEAIPEGTIHLDSLRNHPQTLHCTVAQVHKQTDTHPFLLPYSSGTTGLPKGVCLSHRNLVANLLQYDEVEGIIFAPDQKVISPLPFFHIYGFLASLLYSAYKGITLVTTSGRFDLEEFCKLVEQHRPSRAHLVPPILIGLGKSPVVDQYDCSSIRVISSAAAPMGPETEDAVQKRLQCTVKQAWGMSELSPLGTVNSDFNTKSGSVGPPVSSTYAKIVDKHGYSLGPHQTGELLIKGPQVMMGYLDDPEKTAECLTESGWLRTGDVAYYDEEGFFFITDRIKELIKVRGYQVAPAELEALLLTHEAVNDTAVIQVEDESAGELPRAYIVLENNEGSQATTATVIYEWVKERVAPYKRLDGGIEFVDAIPKSASGKTLRRILRDRVKAATDL